MAQTSPFASLDGTALHGESSEVQSRPNSLARRSVSIFSRKGTETSEPKPPFIAQAAMQIPKQMNEKQKRWMKRRSAPVESCSGTRGTVLNRVPPAKTITMTALEEEMATSPNEEILSNIGGTPTVQAKFEWPPSAEQMDTLWNPNSVPLAQRTMSKHRKDTNARIGVWRNGVTHWDDEARRERTAAYGDPSLQEATGFSPLRRVPTERLNTRSERPTLTVVIPSSELLINDTTLSTIIEPTPQRSVVAFAPTGVMPRFTLTSSTPTLTQLQDEVVSPIDSPTSLSATPPPLKRPKALMRASTDSGSSSVEKRARKSSSSTLNSSSEQDNDSDDSHGTSATSLEIYGEESPVERRKQKRVTFSPVGPSEYSPYCESPSSARLNVEKPLPPTPTPTPPTRAPPPPPLPTERSNLRQLARKPVPRPKELGVREPSPDSTVAQASEGERSTSTPNAGVEYVAPPIPEIEATPIQRHGSVHSVLHPPERAPTIPRRSRKREWRASRNPTRAVQLSVRTARRRKSDSHIKLPIAQTQENQALRRSPSATELLVVTDVAELLRTPIENLLPPTPSIVVNEDFESVSFDSEDDASAAASKTPAEDVLLHILSALGSIQDLFNTARINKGMYRVFKENKSELIASATRNRSPPAWELREWSIPEPTATSEFEPSHAYASAFCQDVKVIESLKRLILERCQTVVRRETMFALSTPSHPNAERFNDAFWRIWCFCKIFGCDKGREDDVTGQLDWLKGGLLAHNQDLSATANVNLDFEMGTVLLNPPEFFAKGNEGGLSARQLYDMTEIWTCLKTLLEGFHGRTEQAWDNGVYDECGIGPGDDEMEEQLLEEWTSYLLTLGPRVVLEMAEFADNTSSAGFALAKVNGWTKWSPPERDGSRNTFLKEPVARLYEERVTIAALRRGKSGEAEKKEMSRKRVATLAAEIKLARASSTFRSLPFIDQAHERPWSALSRRNSTMSNNSARSMASISSMRRQLSNSSRRNTTGVSPLRYSGPPNFSVPRPRSPPTTLWSPRKISPIIEDRVETFNRMSLQNYGSGVPDHTAERAVRRIMDMGFCDSQAREALRMTDMGDGLRVDRAVDMLLRGEA